MITASVGIAMTGPARYRGQALVNAADQAMYRAKRSRRAKFAMAEAAEPRSPARA